MLWARRAGVVPPFEVLGSFQIPIAPERPDPFTLTLSWDEWQLVVAELALAWDELLLATLTGGDLTLDWLEQGATLPGGTLTLDWLEFPTALGAAQELDPQRPYAVIEVP